MGLAVESTFSLLYF